VRRIHTPIESLALFTDGIQYLVLDHSTKKPHRPFFDALWRQLDLASNRVSVGAPSASSLHQGTVSRWLDTMLASPMVTTKTDDDTCIVIARRLP
jgi:hypothetical protein